VAPKSRTTHRERRPIRIGNRAASTALGYSRSGPGLARRAADVRESGSQLASRRIGMDKKAKTPKKPKQTKNKDGTAKTK